MKHGLSESSLGAIAPVSISLAYQVPLQDGLGTSIETGLELTMASEGMFLLLDRAIVFSGDVVSDPKGLARYRLTT